MEYFKVELTKEQAMKVLERGYALQFAEIIECSEAYEEAGCILDENMYDYGLALFRGEVFFLEDGIPSYCGNPILKKKDTYYTNDVGCLEEEEMLNILLLHEMNKAPDAFECLDHNTRFNKDSLEVGCQYIPKKNAVEIAKYILDYYGE